MTTREENELRKPWVGLPADKLIQPNPIPVDCVGLQAWQMPGYAVHYGMSETQWVVLEKELTQLINKLSLEGPCGNVPDFILAQYLTDCLANYIRIKKQLDNWSKP